MNEELEKKLINKYPGFFRYSGWDDIKSSLMCFGFECYDGWYKLLDSLCTDIQRQLDLHDRATWFPDVRRYIRRFIYKEGIPTYAFRVLPYFVFKFIGNLTYTVKGEFRVVQVKEKFGGLRFYVEGGDTVIQVLIDAAEMNSFKICEYCGQDGGKHGFKTISETPSKIVNNPVTTSGKTGWVATKCRDCWEVALKLNSSTITIKEIEKEQEND